MYENEFISPKNKRKVLSNKKLENTFDMKVFPDDKIRIILSAMDLNKKTFEFNDEFFQTLIFENQKKYPTLFSEFSFQSNGTFPYSDLLERIITRAKISRSLKTVNPDFATVQLNIPSLENLKNKYRDDVRDADFEILVTIGKEAKEKVHSPIC